MRKTLLALSSVLLVSVAACATTSSESSVAARERKLAEDCTARGGILTPTGTDTGRPEADNACTITGGASPRIRGN